MFKFVKTTDTPTKKTKKKSVRPKGSKRQPKTPPVVDPYSMVTAEPEEGDVEYLPIPADFPKPEDRLSIPLETLLQHGVCFRQGYRYPLSQAEFDALEKEKEKEKK